MAINVALVSVSMLTILMIYYRDFTRLIISQASTLALSNENFRLANLDALTELPNRRKFFALLDEEFVRAEMRSQRLAVGILDLDGFKPVNDLYGHAVGDTLLTQVGQRLKVLCSENAHLSRLGGDEFAIIITATSGNDELLALGDEMCAALRVPFNLPSATVQVSASVGFAVYPDLATDAPTLFERADYALYHGKRMYHGRATLFSSDHDAAILRDAKIEQALHSADLAREFNVVFQPIVDMRDHTTVRFRGVGPLDQSITGTARAWSVYPSRRTRRAYRQTDPNLARKGARGRGQMAKGCSPFLQSFDQGYQFVGRSRTPRFDHQQDELRSEVHRFRNNRNRDDARFHAGKRRDRNPEGAGVRDIAWMISELASRA